MKKVLSRPRFKRFEWTLDLMTNNHIDDKELTRPSANKARLRSIRIHIVARPLRRAFPSRFVFKRLQDLFLVTTLCDWSERMGHCPILQRIQTIVERVGTFAFSLATVV